MQVGDGWCELLTWEGLGAGSLAAVCWLQHRRRLCCSAESLHLVAAASPAALVAVVLLLLHGRLCVYCTGLVLGAVHSMLSSRGCEVRRAPAAAAAVAGLRPACC
jgi:hypothetical protein